MKLYLQLRGKTYYYSRRVPTNLVKIEGRRDLKISLKTDSREEAKAKADYVVPHKGNRELFFSYANTQNLCKACHDGEKQRMEARGEVKSPTPEPEPEIYF